MGATQTELADGRIIHIGGEHEDFYDPDFNIYNDVVVSLPDEEIEIYGYPKEIFPPTDFHTATLVGDQIIIIGGLGYVDAGQSEFTPVYSLNTSNYRVSKIETSGVMPGWIYEHCAQVGSPHVIIIRDGQVIEEAAGKQRYRQNLEDYSLDLKSGIWRRLTNRNWRQFLLRREEGKLLAWNERAAPLKRLLALEDFVPSAYQDTILPDEKQDHIRIVVNDVPVSLRLHISRIEITIEGELSEELSFKLADRVRLKAENAIGHRCILESVQPHSTRNQI